MTVQSLLRRAANANDEGTALLEVGETSKALKSFQKGLKHLSEAVQSMGGNSNNNSNDDCIKKKRRRSSKSKALAAAAAATGPVPPIGSAAVGSRPIRLGPLSTTSTTATASTTSSSIGQPTMYYSQAFMIHHQQQQHDEIMATERHSFFTAVMIYNTALALHHKGSSVTSTSTSTTSTGMTADASSSSYSVTSQHKAYLKALLFYNESMNLLQPISEEPESLRVLQEIVRNQADIQDRLLDLRGVGGSGNFLQDEHSIWATTTTEAYHQTITAALSAW